MGSPEAGLRIARKQLRAATIDFANPVLLTEQRYLAGPRSDMLVACR